MVSPAPSVRARAILMLLLANLLWGLSFPLVKATGLLQAELLPGAGPWFLAVCTVAPRFLLATLVLLAFRPGVLRGATAAEWRQGLILGLSGAAGMLLQTDALQYTAASTSAFLTQFYALLIPAWLAWRVRRLPAPPVWLACGLVLAGVAVLSGFHPFPPGAVPLGFARGEADTLPCPVCLLAAIHAPQRADFAGHPPAPDPLRQLAPPARAPWGRWARSAWGRRAESSRAASGPAARAGYS